MVKLDRIDRKILTELMRDATQSIAQVAHSVGLSQTPCWKRIQRLQRDRVITARVALVDPQRVGLGLTVFVSVVAAEHGPGWRAAFASAVATLPEVLEVHRMAGETDYLLRVVIPDMQAFDAFYKRLTDAVPLKNVTSHFAVERMKAETVLPIPSA